MNIADNITREEYSYRGGGCELDLTEYGYEGEFLSAYQNYLGGGLLGSVSNSCTIYNWQQDTKLVKLASELRVFYTDCMYKYGCIDEYNELTIDRPESYPGL